MKSKTLITMAVASTFGWSAAAFAGTGHEVVTPFSPNESGEVIFSYEQGFGSTDQSTALGAISDHGSGSSISGGYSAPLSDSSLFSGSTEESASLDMGDSLAAADGGVYSEFYTVAWTPVTVETWDYYLIDDGGSPLLVGISESGVSMPTHELVLIPSASDEMIYELAVVPTSFGAMSADLSSGMGDGEATGE